MRHSWLTKFGDLCLNRLVVIPKQIATMPVSVYPPDDLLLPERQRACRDLAPVVRKRIPRRYTHSQCVACTDSLTSEAGAACMLLDYKVLNIEESSPTYHAACKVVYRSPVVFLCSSKYRSHFQKSAADVNYERFFLCFPLGSPAVKALHLTQDATQAGIIPAPRQP